MAGTLQFGVWIWQKRGRLKRILKRRIAFLKNLLRMERHPEQIKPLPPRPTFLAGDRVRIKSRQEIQKTLNNWNYLKGCGFMEEMWSYCGTRQKIYKVVNQFIDEKDYLVRKCRGIVVLDGAICQGTRDFGTCDRSCFYFWREEWLEKIED